MASRFANISHAEIDIQLGVVEGQKALILTMPPAAKSAAEPVDGRMSGRNSRRQSVPPAARSAEERQTSGMEGRISGMEGRISGMEGRASGMHPRQHSAQRRLSQSLDENGRTSRQDVAQPAADGEDRRTSELNILRVPSVAPEAPSAEPNGHVSGPDRGTPGRTNSGNNMFRGRLSGGERTARGQINITGALSKGDGRRTEPQGPPRSDAYKPKLPTKSTTFRKFYDRGDLPICAEGGRHGEIVWKNGGDFDKLDYHHCLPLFFDGLRETQEPYAGLAMRGVIDLLEKGGERVPPVVSQLIIPIKLAMETNVPSIMCRTLVCLQSLVKCHSSIGVELVQYYRQILPACARFKNKNINCGDRIDYSQNKRQNVGDLIDETLQLMERYGGEDAFINIKYMIPTYESCLLN